MKTVIPDVSTLVMGFAASVASLILSGGTYSKRGAFLHARIMIHQPVTDPFFCISRNNGIGSIRNGSTSQHNCRYLCTKYKKTYKCYTAQDLERD